MITYSYIYHEHTSVSEVRELCLHTNELKFVISLRLLPLRCFLTRLIAIDNNVKSQKRQRENLCSDIMEYYCTNFEVNLCRGFVYISEHKNRFSH